MHRSSPSQSLLSYTESDSRFSSLHCFLLWRVETCTYHVVMWGGRLQNWPQMPHITTFEQLSMWLRCHSQEKVGSIASSAEAGLGHVTCCCQWDVSKRVSRRCFMTFAHRDLPAYCPRNGCDYHQGKEPVVHRDTEPNLPMTPADTELMACTCVRPSRPAEPSVNCRDHLA